MALIPTGTGTATGQPAACFLHSLLRLIAHNSRRPFSLISSPRPPPPPPPSPVDVNEICRILSDNRAPHHDIELPLTPFLPKISNHLVEHVLKRTKTIALSAYRFFLWAKRSPFYTPTIQTYKILISGLGCCKQFPLIWDLVTEIRDRESFGLSSDVFRVIFDFYCKAGLPNEVIRAFERMRDYGVSPGVEDVDHVLYGLCKRRFVREAQGMFDRVKGEFELGVKSWSILMRGWGGVGDFGAARKLFDEMVERGCVADVTAYNCLLDAVRKGGCMDEAFWWFRELGKKGLKPDACTYSIFIRAYCDGDNVYKAFRVLDRMKRYDLVPNVFTYNCIVKKLCMDEKVEEAYLLLVEMKEKGVTPDVWSYNTVLAFHCDHSEVNRALRLVFMMEKEKCMPDKHTYNMLLKMLIRVGRFDRVKEVWEGMEAKGLYPSVSLYAVMIHGFLKKKGKLEEACKYFEVMVDEGIPPYTSTCESLRNRLVGNGLLDQVDVLASKMERSTSCSIQELARTMRGDRMKGRSRREESSEDLSEDEREARFDSKWMATWNRDRC